MICRFNPPSKKRVCSAPPSLPAHFLIMFPNSFSLALTSGAGLECNLRLGDNPRDVHIGVCTRRPWLFRFRRSARAGWRWESPNHMRLCMARARRATLTGKSGDIPYVWQAVLYRPPHAHRIFGVGLFFHIGLEGSHVRVPGCYRRPGCILNAALRIRVAVSHEADQSHGPPYRTGRHEHSCTASCRVRAHSICTTEIKRTERQESLCERGPYSTRVCV